METAQKLFMKTPMHVLKLILFTAAALALSAISAASANSGFLLESIAAEVDEDMVRGPVVAKTDTSLTVGEKVIATTLATTFMKEGKAITLKDIQVGEVVKVVVSKSADDKLQAVSVEVIPRENKEGKP
jgi:hypothetical protein